MMSDKCARCGIVVVQSRGDMCNGCNADLGCLAPCADCQRLQDRLSDEVEKGVATAARVAELEKALKQVRREARLIFFSQAARRIERTCDKALAEGEEKEG